MKNLKELRLKKGLSQQALADRFNLSQQSIYKYEHELAEPDIKTLKELALFFDVSIDYLVGYSDTFEKKEKTDLTEITTDEMQLLQKLRQLPLDVRISIATLIDYLQENKS